MMDNAFFDYISSSALSLVVSGNTGISPFLTLFVLGLTEMMNPELLNMGATMEVALASWWSIGILGVLTLGETIGKCIPVIDELIDSAEVFVVPAISVLASLATLGVLPVPGGSNDDAGLGQSIDVLGMFGGGGGSEFDDYGGGDYRLLQVDNTTTTLVGSGDDDDGNDFGEGFMMFTKVSLVIAGVGISLLIHFFKMLVRMSSLMCSGGCCQPCLTVTEYALVIFGVIFSILAPVFAVLACTVMLVAAGYAINVKFCTKKKEDDDDDDSDTNSNTVSKQKKKSILGSLRRNSSNNNSNDNSNSGVDDIEKQKGSLKKSKRNTSITAPGQPSEEIFAQAEFVSTLPSSVSAPTDNQHENKPEVNATTY